MLPRRTHAQSWPWIVWTLTATLFCCFSIWADEVWLDNGRRLTGKVSVLADGRVEVVAAVGRLVLPGERVVKIERSESLEEAVHAALARLPATDAQSRFELASHCTGQGAATLARQLLHQVLALEPDHQGARLALGFQRFQGEWLTTEQVHAARGEVWFRDRWVSTAEREGILAWETAQASAAAEASRAQTRAAELAASEAQRALAEEQSRPAPPSFLWGPFCCAPPPPLIDPRPPHRPRPERPIRPPEPPRQRPVVHHRSRVAAPPGP